jgi:hypothetical protein
MVAGAAACSRADPAEEARDGLRRDVAAVRSALAEGLRDVSGDREPREFVGAAVGRAGLTGSAVVSTAAWRGATLVTTVVFTSRVQRGGGLSYESRTTRGCAEMSGVRGADPNVTVRDVPCPAAVTPDPGPADATVPVAP